MQGRFSTLMTFVVLALWSTAAPAHQAAEPTRPTRVEDLSLVSEREAAGHVNARVLEYQKLLLEAASIDPESPDSKKRFRDLVVEAHGHLVHAMVWAARVDRLYPEETTIGGRLLDGGFAIVGLGATGLGAAGVMFYGVLAGLNNAFNDVVGHLGRRRAN
ncbi:MAG TPA: hypothetical protein PLH57_04880 [Oligoflexia bacterium]|nr:hypothetical protein [Oligoflexia bacterium]